MNTLADRGALPVVPQGLQNYNSLLRALRGKWSSPHFTDKSAGYFREVTTNNKLH